MSEKEQPKFKFKVKTYWVDSDDYYYGNSGQMEIQVFANDAEEACVKAKKVSIGKTHNPRHDCLKAEVISAEEILS